MRAHIPYLVRLLVLVPHEECKWNIVRREADNLTSSFVMVVVVFRQFGWHVTFRSSTCDGRRFQDAAHPFASQVLHVDDAVAVRACRWVIRMLAPAVHVNSGVLMWRRGADADSVVHCVPEGKDLSRPSVAKALAHEVEEVDQQIAFGPVYVLYGCSR